jgi:hypothetical protein
MNLKSVIAKPFARYISKQVQLHMRNAVADQATILNQLIRSAQNTQFGSDHRFSQLNQVKDFQDAVPIRDYEQISSYIQLAKQGNPNILWPGKPLYFAKTSGTTSGAKYIPISKESMPAHIHAARNALLCYIAETGNTSFVDGQMIFLSGSPELEKVNGIFSGRLSGIVNHHVPGYLRKNQLPTYKTNCIEDWETKLDAIVNETMHRNMTLISGIPPWMQMYFDRLLERSGKSIKDLFPNLSLIVHGGVNFEPYRAKLFETIGSSIDCIETFPASEGFFAFQDTRKEEGLLLNTRAGMFFEFVPAAEIFNEKPTRLTLNQVEKGVNYALIISSNAGLWAYNIGDTIKFVSLDPYRIIVTGRIKHFISAFGEHVIAEEVEFAMRKASEKYSVKTIEYSVAPLIAGQGDEISCHEWLVAFENEPEDLEKFAEEIDQELRKKNIYYEDLRKGNILSRLKIQVLQKDAFILYMKSIGKLGGQNKVPRLSNDRTIADAMQAFRKKN